MLPAPDDVYPLPARACARLLSLCGLLLALPPGPVRAADDRAALLAERERLEAKFAAEQAQCRERFAVTACVDDVRRRRREALASTRARLLDLDDAERRQRAEERRRTVQDKQRRAAERPVPVEAPASVPRRREPEPARLPPAPVDREAVRREAAAEAARRAQASQRRRAEIEARQARIAERQAAQGRKPADPLPVPPPLPPASAAR